MQQQKKLHVIQYSGWITLLAFQITGTLLYLDILIYLHKLVIYFLLESHKDS